MTAPLPLPKELQDLIDDGLWPLGNQSAQRQNLYPLVSKENVRRFAADERTIFFYPYPFATVSEARKHNKYWEDERSALSEIDPERALIIGDFGLGSDSPIILDYRTTKPRLLRLRWGESNNHWEECGLSVAELVYHVRNYRAEQVNAPNERR
jgi:hypothetical protein